MKDELVLCIRKEDANTSCEDIKTTSIAWLNRSYCENEPNYPQIIPVIVISNEQGQVLSYTRRGSENRLHGLKSILIGGHVNLEDYEKDIFSTLLNALEREVKEELGQDLEDMEYYAEGIINLDVDDVSRVHSGRIFEAVIAEIEPSEELALYEWLTPEQVLENIEQYEAWSQFTIKFLMGIEHA